MKKRLLSLVLTALMLLSLLPSAAFAAGAAPNAAEDTPAGNLCRPSDGATVTATASAIDADAHGAEKAIDGDESTRWASETAATAQNPQYLLIDLGTQRSFSCVKLYWEQTSVTAYTLQVSSDNSTWTTVHTRNTRLENLRETLTFDPVRAQYLKVNVTAFDDQGSAHWSSVSIYEVEVYKNAASMPVDVQAVADAVTFSVQDGRVVMNTTAAEELAGDWEFEYSFAANLEQVVGADGAIYTPLVDTRVELDKTVTRKFDNAAISSDPSQPIQLTIPGAHTANEGNPKPRVIPELAEWYSSAAQMGQKYTLTSASKIVAPAALDGVARELKNDIKDLFGFEPSIADTGAAAGDIVLAIGSGAAVAGFDDETYLMEVSDKVVITATASTGAYWGTRSVLQALKLSGDRTIAQGAARDYPEFKVRSFVLDVGRKPISMDMLREMAKNMAWYKLNDFHVHLNDNLIFLENYIPGWTAGQPTTPEDYAKANDAYAAFRLESDIQAETGGNPLTAKDYAYTKDEFKAFIEDSAAIGVDIVPEIDAPAHAKSITDAFPSLRLFNANGMQSHPYNDHLNLSEEKYARSIQVVKDIFDEYLDGTFGQTVHFGADEYYDNHAAYRRFFKDMAAYLKDAGKTPRVWGSLTRMSGQTTNGQSYEIEADSNDTQGVQMNIWNTGWANPQEMYNLGFDLINVTDGPCYMVPSGGGNRGGYGDYLSLTDIYNWTPNCIGSTWIPASSSQALGGAYAIWNDNIDTQASGLDEVDIFDRFFDTLPVISVKMWGEGAGLDRTLSELQADAAVTGLAPNTNPYCDAVNGEKPSYTFDSADGLTLTNAEIQSGALALKGGASYAGTGFDRLGWGNILTFQVKVDSTGVIFEGDHAYGEYAVKALPVSGKDDKWKLGFSRELYDYEFDVELPIGQLVTLTIANGKQSTKLTYNGTEYPAVGKFAAKADSNTRFTGKTGISNSSFELPMARIGSKTNAITGTVGSISVTSRVNLALGRPVTVSGTGSCMGNDKPDTPAPERAVDGAVEEFEHYAWVGADMTTNRDANGNQTNPQWIVVDLGEEAAAQNLTPEQINIAYGRRSFATKYDVQTSGSLDGPWTSLLTQPVSRAHAWGYLPTITFGPTGDSITASSSIGDTAARLRPDAKLKRYVRLYVTEVNAANGSAANISGNNGQCKSVAVTELQVMVRLPQSAAAGVSGVILPDDQHSVTLYLNPAAGQSGTVTLTPKVMPESAANRNVTYSSSQTDVAAVSDDGKVTAVAAGSAAITVTTVDGGKTATCEVTVKSNPTAIAVKDGDDSVTENDPVIIYNNKGGSAVNGKRSSVTLTAEMTPANATETDVTWTRADNSSGLITMEEVADNSAQRVISAVGQNERDVGEKVIEVASQSNPAVKTTFKIRVLHCLVHDVTISVRQDAEPRPGAVLEADVSQLNLDQAGIAGLTYQWYRDGSPISGANDETYTLTDDDIGGVISVKVTATPSDTYFYEGERTSANTITVPDHTKTYYTASYTITPENAGSVVLDKTSVEQNASVSATVTANPGFAIGSVTVDGNEVTGVNGVYTVDNVTADVEFVVTFEAVKLTITHDLHHVTCSLTDHTVDYNAALTITLTPDQGYALPDAVTVTMEGRLLADGSDYTYSSTSGELKFEAGKITGALKISVEAERILIPLVSVSIAGSAKVGERLVANVNPAEAASYVNYQWIHIDADGSEEIVENIEGAAGMSRVITDASLGKQIKVKVVPAEGSQYTGDVISQATAAIIAADAPDIPVEMVSLDKQSLSVEQNKTGRLVAIIHPAAATNQNVTWTSDHEDVATVDSAGVVTGVSVGAATITVTTEDGNKSASCAVTVTAAAPSVDLTGLQAAYDAAKDVANDDYTDESWNAFETARSAAKVILDAEGKDSTQAQVDAAVKALTDAQKALEEKSEDLPVIPVPSTPSTGTTTVEKNDDGSTTTTVTDKKTGTVTETTEKPDGSKETVETKKDGTVTETVEKTDGSKEIVETKKDGSVTETKIDAEGGKTEKAVDADKNVAVTVTDKDGEVLIKVELPAEIPAPEEKFTDVPEGHWAEEAINQAAGLGLVNGVGSGEFNKEGNMKRGDLALILSRMSNADVGSYEPAFSDVAADTYYANGVAWASKVGVVTGRGEDTFKPEDTITREELALMLYRYAKLLKLDSEASADELDTFTDGGSTHSWAADGVAWCVKNGILKGKGGSVLDPQTNVTRAEVAVMLQRFMDLMK